MKVDDETRSGTFLGMKSRTKTRRISSSGLERVQDPLRNGERRSSRRPASILILRLIREISATPNTCDSRGGRGEATPPTGHLAIAPATLNHFDTRKQFDDNTFSSTFFDSLLHPILPPDDSHSSLLVGHCCFLFQMVQIIKI